MRSLANIIIMDTIREECHTIYIANCFTCVCIKRLEKGTVYVYESFEIDSLFLSNAKNNITVLAGSSTEQDMMAGSSFITLIMQENPTLVSVDNK